MSRMSFSWNRGTMPAATLLMIASAFSGLLFSSSWIWSFSVNGTHYTNKIIGVPEGIGTEALNGGWTAGVDAWSKGGGGAVGNIVYLRGKGKDLYNMYLFKYGGVDQATGLPLFASTVSSSNIDKLQKASHVYGDIKEGNVVYTTDYSLATRQEFGSATP